MSISGLRFFAWLGLGALAAGEADLSALYGDCEEFRGSPLEGGPICGSDGVTYSSLLHLSCLNFRRQRQVRMTGKGACGEAVEAAGAGGRGCPWSPVFAPVCGSDSKTYANLEALNCSAKLNNLTGLSAKHGGMCAVVDACLFHLSTAQARPVCASNGRTYPSPQALHCLRNFHSELDVAHEGGCSAQEVAGLITSRRQLCALARNRYEWNPVCASNNRTYLNPFVLLCLAPHVSLSREGSCGDAVSAACRRAEELEGLWEGGEGGRGRGRGRRSGVCATDGQTYLSSAHLLCAARYNRFLEKLHDGACALEDSPCERARLVADGGTPVCGSDGITYTSPSALFCLQRTKDPQLEYVHEGICLQKHGEGRLWAL